MTTANTSGSEVAIIGIGGRFPQADNVDEFWVNLCDGVESILTLTDEELRREGVEPQVFNQPNYVKAKAVLKNIEMFDAAFFGYSPREAEMLDPQHRLFLECAWEAFERAGYDTSRYESPVGVFAGASNSGYVVNLFSNPDASSLGSFQVTIGNDKDHLPTRVSYKLDLRGPSVNVQTACSTSLVAVHMACQSLLSGDCEMALAGGVSVAVPHNVGYFYQEGGVTSPDGHCRAFDAEAAGTVSGNGVAVVLLKRLADALADGDSIHAVIKGSAVNNDGARKVGYTAPGVEGQAAVVADALAVTGVDPASITYVETHGTGTALGDPIEVAALTQAFAAGSARNDRCALGSVKSNVGHLDAAAGVTGLIKATLALKHKLLPPSLHFVRPNPQINFADSPFYVNDELTNWESADDAPRRAGVSSFGIGGTNAHAILEEAPAVEPSGPSRPWQLLTLSAKTASALETATGNLAEHLRRNPEINLADAAYTLHVGRKAFEHRRIVVCRDAGEALAALGASDPKRVAAARASATPRPVAFMFPGQGAQYAGMSRGLYESEPLFREQVDRLADLLPPRLGLDLRDVLYPTPERAEEAARLLKQTFITQPALFVVEYALARLWMEWGVRPAAMIGHSVGEYVAACLAGVFSPEDALTLVAERGRLMQSLPAGLMLAVAMPEKEAAAILPPGLSVAAVNSPDSCVVSGPPDLVEDFRGELIRREADSQLLHTSHGFHSAMMEPILGEFTELVRRAEPAAPKIPFISNVTGTWITDAEAADPRYWARHLRQTVRFADGVRELLREPERLFLEVGPGHTLKRLAASQSAHARTQVFLNTMPHPQDKQPEGAVLLKTLGQLWLAGASVDAAKLYDGERRRRIELPTYPFERQRYWIERRPLTAAGGRGVAAAAAKNPNIVEWFYVP